MESLLLEILGLNNNLVLVVCCHPSDQNVEDNLDLEKKTRRITLT